MLDFAYTADGFMYWNFGKEGVSWNWEDGRPIFSDLLHNDPNGIHGAMEMYVGSVWNGPTIQATEVLVQRNRPQSIEANNTWFYNNRAFSEFWVRPRGMALSAEESGRAEIIEGPLATYVNEMSIRFFTGAEPIDNYDDFVATMYSMGLEELLSLYQAAYERWLAR
jgi:putative aldouronate transport system substrate-binding protein